MKRIIYTQDNGTVAIIVPAPEFIEQFNSINEAMETLVARHSLHGTDYSVVDTSEIPSNRTFRNAWVKDARQVKTDIPKAKLLAHDKRRTKREEELKPFDDIIAKQIPGKNASEAEVQRQAIRDKHALIQTNIDAATTEAQLLIQMELLK